MTTPTRENLSYSHPRTGRQNENSHTIIRERIHDMEHVKSTRANTRLD